MRRVLLATSNPHKVREISELLAGIPLDIRALSDYPGIPTFPEDGKTYGENSLKKALWVMEKTLELTLADDSGLEVDALDGAPGIFSSRFGGEGLSFPQKSEIILSLLAGIPEDRRTARFVCSVTLAFPGGRTETFNGTCEGLIAHEPRGERGFGYDPIFLLPGSGRTMAELSPAEKNEISHRARAVKKARPFLTTEQ
jgi:XTP/dITP diphosphohydrolase